MKLKIEMSDKEKKTALVVAVVLVIIIYYLNRKYFYILDAQFENDEPKEVILKTGFILPVKLAIQMKDGFSGKIKFYGYQVNVFRNAEAGGFDITIASKSIFSSKYGKAKKLTTIYKDQYYVETHKEPTGRAYLS